MADEIIKPMGGLGALAAKAADVTQPEKTEPAAEVTETSDDVIYTCQPMTNYSFGKYRFENGQMRLSPDEAAEFDSAWKSQPGYLQRTVTKVDVAVAEARLKEILASKGGMQSGMTTTGNNNPIGEGKLDPASTDSTNTQQ